MWSSATDLSILSYISISNAVFDFISYCILLLQILFRSNILSKDELWTWFNFSSFLSESYIPKYLEILPFLLRAKHRRTALISAIQIIHRTEIIIFLILLLHFYHLHPWEISSIRSMTWITWSVTITPAKRWFSLNVYFILFQDRCI